MRITFLTPHVGISGGVKIILGYADRLAKRGHKVTVICPLIRVGAPADSAALLKSRFKAFLKNLLKQRPECVDIRAGLKFVPVIKEGYIPTADVVVATAWQTAKIVNELPTDRGRKFYLVQHYESLFHGDKSEADGSYTYPLKKIVVSSWLKEIMEKQFHSTCELVEDPVDLDVLYPTRKSFNKDKVICLLNHPWEWKGTAEGLECFNNARKLFPKIKLIMYGAHPNTFDVPCEYYYRPGRDTLRQILNKADIFLCASWKEGFGLCAAEAMACGCALVTTDNGGSQEYAIHEQTALVSPERNVAALTDNLIRVIKDENLLMNIARKGQLYVQKFSWENAVDKLERIFNDRG